MQAAELKFTSIKNKPQFIVDLARYITMRRLSIFIEVVDKRFFICANLISNFLIPPVGDFNLHIDAAKMNNLFAEHLYAKMPLHILQAFVEACGMPSVESTRKAYSAIVGWLDSIRADDDVAAGLYLYAADIQNEFETLTGEEPNPRRFLPIPDDSKGGKPLWMLPNLTSFTNIYARINLLHGRKLQGVRLVHDEQLEFDHILRDGKRSVEAFRELGVEWPMPRADYVFAESASLGFETSSRGTGIQIADVLAGFIKRYVQEVALYRKAPAPEYQQAFLAIQDLSNPRQATGINFFLPSQFIFRLGLEPIGFG